MKNLKSLKILSALAGSKAPTYSISPDTTNVSEGDSVVTWTILTSNVPDGTILYWTNSGTADASDFAENVNSGSVIISNNAASISLTISADATTEGSETIILRLRTSSGAGPIVATSPTVTIADTSLTPTYEISPSVSPVDEGSSVTFTINTTNVANGTTLYYTNGGTTVSGDFSSGSMSGSITINSNTASVSYTLSNDLALEGTETIVLQLRTGSTSGTIVATSSINVSDTSVPTYGISPSVSSVNEGSSVTWTVTTAGVPNGTTLYWTNTGTTVAADFTENVNSGSFTINTNNGSITLNLVNDLTTEGVQNIIIQVRTGSTTGTIVATSDTVTVNDTSVETYSISPSANNVNEGSSVTWTVTTGGVPNGTTLYWTNSGNSTSADFSDGTNSGSFTINSNSGTISRTLLADNITEGAQTIIIQVRTGSTSGTVVATSSTVTINDTSVETYSVSPSTTSVNEGSSVTWTVTTAGVPNGTTLYWTNAGTTGSADFTQAVNSGSFSISSNSGSFQLTLSSDQTLEGSETIIIQIRTGSTGGTVVATAATVTVNDTSVPYSIEYIIVGGGGGGGGSSLCYGGGGGGGGGVITGSYIGTPGTARSVTVGAGGSGFSGSGSATAGAPGSSTVFVLGSPLTAFGGGGGGGGATAMSGCPGGSGGGGFGPSPGGSACSGQGCPGGAGWFTNPGQLAGANPSGGGGGFCSTGCQGRLCSASCEAHGGNGGNGITWNTINYLASGGGAGGSLTGIPLAYGGVSRGASGIGGGCGVGGSGGSCAWINATVGTNTGLVLFGVIAGQCCYFDSCIRQGSRWPIRRIQCWDFSPWTYQFPSPPACNCLGYGVCVFSAYSSTTANFWQVNQPGPLDCKWHYFLAADDEARIYVNGTERSYSYQYCDWGYVTLTCGYHTLCVCAVNYDDGSGNTLNPAMLKYEIRHSFDGYADSGYNLDGYPQWGAGGGGGGYCHCSAANYCPSSCHRSGNGGSGVVWIRYAGSQRGTGGGDILSCGGYTYHKFSSPGTFTD